MFKLITEHPVAYNSPDHINPYGSVLNNSSNANFNNKLYKIFNNEKINIIDFGCAGGGFVYNCIQDGHTAIGLEGSSLVVERSLGHWVNHGGLHNKNLFLCDVTRDFSIYYDDELFQADVITSWEFLEHIHPNDIDKVLENTVKHLKQDGLYICSIAGGTPEYCKWSYGKHWGLPEDFPDKRFHHQNHKWPEWWDNKFAEFGFLKRNDYKTSFEGEFVRGPGHGCSHHETEERLYSKEDVPERLSCSMNRVLQLSKKQCYWYKG